MWKVEYSHDGVRWFEYGADASHSGHIFTDMSLAESMAESLISTKLASSSEVVEVYRGLSNGECQCAICSFARTHA